MPRGRQALQRLRRQVRDEVRPQGAPVPGAPIYGAPDEMAPGRRRGMRSMYNGLPRLRGAGQARMARETCRLPLFSKAWRLSREDADEAVDILRKSHADSGEAGLPQEYAKMGLRRIVVASIATEAARTGRIDRGIAELDEEDEGNVAHIMRIPRPTGAKQTFVLHLFSGRGRREDARHCCEMYWPASQALVYVIPIDLACRETLGNPVKKETTDFWLAMAARLARGPRCWQGRRAKPGRGCGAGRSRA